MGAIFIKIHMNVLEFFGRLLIFNRNLPEGFECVKNIEYSAVCKLDVYYPKTITEQLAVVICIHGGGWIAGSRKNLKRQAAAIAVEGFIVLNIDYRLSPKYKHPSQMEDIANVLGWLMINAKKYNADINRIFFAGNSAGAHIACLAACICTNEKQRDDYAIDFPVSGSQIAGVILIYGAYNIETVVNSGFYGIRIMVKSYIGTKKPREYSLKHQISPVMHITKKFPPVFIAAGEVDPLFNQSVELVEVLKKKDIRCEKLFFDKNTKNAKHGYINFHKRECAKKTHKKMIKYLKHTADVYNQIKKNMYNGEKWK